MEEEKLTLRDNVQGILSVFAFDSTKRRESGLARPETLSILLFLPLFFQVKVRETEKNREKEREGSEKRTSRNWKKEAHQGEPLGL